MRWWSCVLVALLAFGGGWIARPAPAAHVSSPAAAIVASEPGACTDELAMRANANLTAQVGDYKQRWMTARDAVTPRTTTTTTGRADPFATERDELQRLAQRDMMRIRVPCGSSMSGARHETVGPGRTTRTIHAQAFADAAALGEGEMLALSEVLLRANQRTWDAMKEACPRIRDRDDIEDVADRIQRCRTSVLDPSRPTMHAALREVADARAAGAVAMRNPSPEERVLFALASSTDGLFDDMVRSMGRDNARRALDYGLACTDDIVYHAPEIVEVSLDID
jgi:hypothetical protein